MQLTVLMTSLSPNDTDWKQPRSHPCMRPFPAYLLSLPLLSHWDGSDSIGVKGNQFDILMIAIMKDDNSVKSDADSD